MGVGAGLYMYDVVVKSSRSLSRLLMSSCFYCETHVCNVMLKFLTTFFSNKRHDRLAGKNVRLQKTIFFASRGILALIILNNYTGKAGDEDADAAHGNAIFTEISSSF